MKVIFLDCDGVVCTARSHIVLGHPKGERIWSQWDLIACEAIRLCCEKESPNLKLVISSTWRYADPDLLRKRLNEFNLNQYVWDDTRDWATPRMRDGTMVRGNEIEDWLNRHPEVEDYKIIDDDQDMLQDQMNKLIHTDSENGMTFENIRQLMRWARVLKS